jgi:hypothetical protein
VGLFLTESRRRHAAGWLIIAVWVVVALFTILDYGISWDEKVQARYGEMSLDYYASGFRDRDYESLYNLRFYGPFFEMLPAITYKWMPWWKFEIRHMFIALFATLGLVGLKKVADRAGPVVSAFALLTLLLTPAFYGHAFFNSKDIPFAAMFALSIHALMRVAEQPSWKSLGIAAGVLGCAMAIRVAGVLAFVFVLTSFLIALIVDASQRSSWLRKLGALLASLILGWLFMVALWPWSQSDPIGNPILALRTTASFNEFYEVLFEGRYIPSNRLPARYLGEMFAITTPVAVLTLVAVGIVASLGAIRRREQTLAHIAALLWAFVPPALQIALRAPVYDGTRHFLFVYPAMALLAGIGAHALTTLPRRRSLAVVALVIALAGVVPAMVRLHPYQYVYYNAFAGGTRGAEGRFELDYWSTSYREAALWLEENRCPGRAPHVLYAADVFSDVTLTWFLSRDYELRFVQNQGIRGTLPPGWDFYVGLNRQRMHENFPDAPLAKRIERAGATLAVIRGGCVR